MGGEIRQRSSGAHDRRSCLPGRGQVFVLTGCAGVDRAAGGDRRVVQAGGPDYLGRHAALFRICASHARGRKADRGGWARSGLPRVPSRDVGARRRPKDGGAPAAGGVGHSDDCACSNRAHDDAQRRGPRANHPRGDVSRPTAVQARPHRRPFLCGPPQPSNGWIARCHLRRQSRAVLRGRCLRPVRGARGVFQIAGSPGPNRRRAGGRLARPARHARARCRDCCARRNGTSDPRCRFPVRCFRF